MKIVGQLKDDILSGKAVLFIGAGASQAAGLLGAVDLAEYLYSKAGSPVEYSSYRTDLSKLVARIEKNPNFPRRWVNTQLIDYFLESKNYRDLSYHKKLFDLRWQAIFTTNFDISFELAESSIKKKLYRLLPIVNPKDNLLLNNSDSGKLHYYKIHGCCRELESHPSSSPPLVITQKDYQDSISRNQAFLDVLRKFAYNSSIVFLGFQAHKSENNVILANIQEAYNSIVGQFHQPFRPVAVLKDADAEVKADLEDIGITPIDGTFEEFVEAALLLGVEQEKVFGSTAIDDNLYIKAAGKEVTLTRAECKQYSSQFSFYYEGYVDEQADQIKDMPPAKIVDLWKSEPSDVLLANYKYIQRTVYPKAVSQLKQVVNNISKAKKPQPQIICIVGNRASGKTVLTKQLALYAYSELNQPVLFLSAQASYFDTLHGSNKEINISGWDRRLIDKFLSPFYQENNENGANAVPILIADHLSYRQLALDSLFKYLENHGKPCVMILTYNSEEWLASENDRFLQLHNHFSINIEHKLSDDEIKFLFDKISYDEPRVRDNKDILIKKAIQETECNRDILFILYTWFDKQFRKLDEIIVEEMDKLNAEPLIKELYLVIAIFHQYSFSPRISLCAEALDINISNFSDLRTKPIFKAFVNLSADVAGGSNETASTRHSEFSRKILNLLLVQQEEQISIMEKVLQSSDYSDLQFVRDFLNYISHYRTSFTVEQVTKLKIATEKKLSKDSVLNHQFGAYLIREKVRLEEARYYLDIALNENIDNPAIIHSLGNLCYTLYKNALDNNDITKALENYDAAKDYFSKSRALVIAGDEHAYFTDISMTEFRISHSTDDDKTRTLLNAEKQALIFEALTVVPFERQNLLRKFIGSGTQYHELSSHDRGIILEKIFSGDASPILLEYYATSLLSIPKNKNWYKLRDLVALYSKDNNDIAIATVVSSISKKAFIFNAETRFEFLRKYYDSLVRYREAKMSFAFLAEYIRLLVMDALVLEKYDFLRSVLGEINDLFRESKPRFLKDEFILDKKYYFFTDDDKVRANLFEQCSEDFYNVKKAKRFSSLVNLSYPGQERYFNIEIDPITRFFIRGFKRDVASHSGRIELNYCIKHTYDSFMATEFRT